MARRSRGDGTVFFDASRGCWVGAVDIGRDPETGRRRRRKVSAPTKIECRDKLAVLLEEKRKTGCIAPRNITVESAVRGLLANPPAGWRSDITYQVNSDLCGRIIAGVGKITLVKLTPGDVEQFLGRMAREGLSAKTIRATRGLLARAIRRAERDGLVGRNAAALADLPAAGTRQSKSMTLAQARQLLGSGLDPWWRAYVAAGIMCGLRPGELLGLRWGDVDFGAGVVRVRTALHGDRIGELKTGSSKRTMVLPAAAAGALKAHRAQQAVGRLRLEAVYRDLDLVFCRADGSPCDQKATGKQFKRRCAAAGIGADWHPHELRHTHVSLLSDAGVNLEDISDSVGHKNPVITAAVYRHRIADTVTRAAAAMDRIFGTEEAS